MRRVFGDLQLFGFAVSPLQGGPPEADASASLTWAALEIWARRQNLTSHAHLDTGDVHAAAHWPVIYVARWIVRAWRDMFERQRWPIPSSSRNARDLCEDLDALITEDEDAADELLDLRDGFVATHSLLAASAGGLFPDIYFGRDGDRVSVSWRTREAGSAHFHHGRSEIDVPVGIFLDATKGLLRWVHDALAGSGDPVAVQDRAEIARWLGYVDSADAAAQNLAGFAGLTTEELDAVRGDQAIESFFELDEAWSARGAELDASTSWPAMVFRALSAEISIADVLNIVEALRRLPASPADGGVRRLAQELPGLSGRQTDFQQGYALAAALREHVGNLDRAFNIEPFLSSLGVTIVDTLELGAETIDGGCVWDDHRGPLILVNPGSVRARTEWGRRMVLAHELCHLLVDRREAVPLTVLSGPWTTPTVERRANAFAAELLLPLPGIRRVVGGAGARPTTEHYRALMDEFGVGETTCVEHVHNRLRLRSSYT